jgi:hypothetical protein
MKQVVNVLVLISVTGIILGALLRFANMHSLPLVVISNSLLLLSVLLMPFAYQERYKKLTLLRQKVMSVVVWLGIVLISSALTVGYFGLPTSHILFVCGLALLLIYLVYVLVIILVYRLQKDPFGKPWVPDALAGYGLGINDIEQYTGVYNNEKIKLAITITYQQDTLVAKATNQPAFYLEIIGKNEFKYPGRDIAIVLEPEKNLLTLKQHGGFFQFVKEEW